MILDVMLPGIDGFELCRIIRDKGNVPVIMVTARKDDIDKIRGLGLGADDYIVKPFSPAEMVARVKAHIDIHERLIGLKRKEKNVDRRDIVIKGLRIKPVSRRVFVDNSEITFVNKDFDLLMFFAENPEIVFSKETLFDRVWGENEIGRAHV